MAMTEWELCRTAVNRKRMQVILCDDDPDFSKELHTELTRSFAKMNAEADIFALERLAQITHGQLETCDMAFLDIDFEDEDYNGIQIARRLREVNSRALIFFVTNFIDYAPEGYEVRAFRYILKRDLQEVLERYLLQAMEHFAEGKEYLRLSGRDDTVTLPLEQIFYLEVMDHCVSIHTENLSYDLNATLSGLEEKLSSHGFLRIHKSFLVNMSCIRKFRSRECMLLDGTVLAVSERSYAQQKQKYLLWKGLK